MNMHDIKILTLAIRCEQSCSTKACQTKFLIFVFFSFQDHDLQQKIDHEIKMREGTVKLLAASKHPAQMLEAAKNLLTSNTRILSYMMELQKRKTAEVLGRGM